MKKLMSILCAVTAFSVVGFASHSAEGENLYVEPGSIYVAPNGIFLNIEGELYGVTSVNIDEDGIYIPSPVLGFCGKHGYYPGNSTVCPKCMAEKKK